MVDIRLAVLSVAVIVVISLVIVVGRDSGDPFRPLLIPTAHASAPDQVNFYGGVLEHDAFIWCLDRSCSMGWQGQLNSLKIEVASALSQLTPSHQFSLLSFSSDVHAWSTELEPATPLAFDSALGWLDVMFAQGTADFVPALAQAFDIAESASNPCIILAGDSDPSCFAQGSCTLGQVLGQIANLNTESVPIHTFKIGSTTQGATLPDIAAQSSGIYVDTDVALGRFRRGDANSDTTVDLADAAFMLAAAFVPCSPAPLCLDASDVDDNGVWEPLVDSIYLLQFLLVAGAPPIGAPFGVCAFDPTPDAVTCDVVCP